MGELRPDGLPRDRQRDGDGSPRLTFLAYGIVCYLFFLVVFLYAVGVIGGRLSYYLGQKEETHTSSALIPQKR
jgi:hypothetical protein